MANGYGRRAVALGLLLAIPAPALAAEPVCAPPARPFIVPLAPLGISVVVKDGQAGGIYPDLLHTISAKTGCEFTTTVVPRARLEALFEVGKADILMPATRTPQRDRYGAFIPLLDTRATLISLAGRRAPLHSVRQLLEQRELRLALVRGNDYGEAYQTLVKQLSAQGRVFLEADAVGVARLIDGGIADATIMTPTSFTAAIKGNVRVHGMLGRLRIEALDELPWHESGIYLSHSSLTSGQRKMLSQQLRAAYKSNAVWENFKRYYPPEVVALAARPR